MGDTCYSQCPMHCFEGVCNKNNGNCIKGCSPGLYGDTCDNTCSHGCVGGTCDQQSGICHAGCKTNWAGYLCGGKYSNENRNIYYPIQDKINKNWEKINTVQYSVL